MNQQQINRLEMYRATNDYLDAQNALWSAIPIIGTYKNQLSALIAGIEEAASSQAGAQVFIGKSVAALKKLMAEKLDLLDDILEAYAADVGNAELEQQASNSKTDYLSLPNEDFEIKSKQMIALLEQHMEAMADYGMTSAQVDDIKQDMDQFLASRGKPRAYQVASRAATKDMEALFKEGTAITEKLDKVLSRFKRANASFHNGYTAARKVVND